MVVHVHVEKPAQPPGPERPRALHNRRCVLRHLDMLDEREQEHDRRPQKTRQNQEPCRPMDSERDRQANRGVDGQKAPRVARHLPELVVRRDPHHRVGVAPAHQAQQDGRMKAHQSESGDFHEPPAQRHRGVERHLAVLADMPREGVVVGVGIAPVQRLLHVDQRADPQHRFVQPMAAKGRAVRRLVADGICRDAQHHAMHAHRRPHPPGAEGQPHEAARYGRSGAPVGQIDKARTVASPRDSLQRFPVERHATRGGVGRRMLGHCNLSMHSWNLLHRGGP